MAKPAKKKAAAIPTQTRTGRSPNPSRAKHHGRTFCRHCFKKIAAGNTFCNSVCRGSLKV